MDSKVRKLSKSFFSDTFKLAWNLIRDYFIYQGITEIRGSRDAVKTGFKYGLIDNSEIWFEIISARNLSSHTYNQILAERLIENICNRFYFEFKKLLETFLKLRNK
jgi:nucleotidyltransferase substrate binding protein (TIGR01987 family)